MKVCTTCGVEKELGDFSVGANTHNYYCKACVGNYDRLNEKKPLSQLKANKDCNAKRRGKWYEVNKERSAEQLKVNKERAAEFNAMELTIEGLAAEKKKKQQQKQHELKEWGSVQRRWYKSKASPPWITEAEKNQIRELYMLAKTHGEKTGEVYHIDHIHPLNHHLICGLHVPANLQILEASVNIIKKNKFEPYIESECDFTELWQVRNCDIDFQGSVM